jgi:hypothetical protein
MLSLSIVLSEKKRERGKSQKEIMKFSR